MEISDYKKFIPSIKKDIKKYEKELKTKIVENIKEEKCNICIKATELYNKSKNTENQDCCDYCLFTKYHCVNHKTYVYPSWRRTAYSKEYYTGTEIRIQKLNRLIEIIKNPTTIYTIENFIIEM